MHRCPTLHAATRRRAPHLPCPSTKAWCPQVSPDLPVPGLALAREPASRPARAASLTWTLQTLRARSTLRCAAAPTVVTGSRIYSCVVTLEATNDLWLNGPTANAAPIR